MTSVRKSVLDAIDCSTMGYQDKPALLPRCPAPLDAVPDGAGVVMAVEGRKRKDHRTLVLASMPHAEWAATSVILDRSGIDRSTALRVLDSLHTAGAISRRTGFPGHEWKRATMRNSPGYKPSAREVLMTRLTSDWQESSDLVAAARVERHTLTAALRELVHEGLAESEREPGTHYLRARATNRLLVWRMSNPR